MGSPGDSMPLNFWCWNIQRINAAKVANFADEIRYLVRQQRRSRRTAIGGDESASRFYGNADMAEIGIILENQTNPDIVCAGLQRAFNTKQSGGGELQAPYRFVHHRIGGVAGTQENIIIAYRNCAEPVLTMLQLGDLHVQAMVQDMAAEQALPTRLSLRARGFGAHDHLAPDDIADIGSREAEAFFDHLMRDSTWYRGLAVLTVNVNGREYNVGSVHLPGPSAHERYSQEINRRIVTEFVMPWMMQGNMIDVVMGDFNIHGRIDGGANINDLTHERIRSGTTITETLDFSTGFLSRNQFDKCLVNQLRLPPGTLDADALALITHGANSIRIRTFREVSDHAGLFLFLP